MRFAHISDCHLGSWSSHPELAAMPSQAFEKAINICVNETVDFILISGDLFDTSLPCIDVLRHATATLSNCREAGIPVYTIPGSHDFSPTGKTMLSVLEAAGLLKNVARGEESDGKLKLYFTIDEKTGAKITGVIGRKGSLEKSYFENLDRSIEKEDGFKVFMFHSGIEEYKPANLKDAPALPLSLLPENFDYYASGHVHEKNIIGWKGRKIVFPGCLFPAGFDELEKYDSGFFIFDEGRVERKPVKLFDVMLMEIDADRKSASQAEEMALAMIEKSDLKDKILLMRFSGTLSAGSASEIDFRKINASAYEKGGIAVKRNIGGLLSQEFQEIAVEPNISVPELERKLITEHAGQGSVASFDTKTLVSGLMSVLHDEKSEAESARTYEERVKSNAKKVLGL